MNSKSSGGAAAQDLQEREMTQVEIAEKHGVTRSAVSKWNSTLEEDGIEALESTNEEGNQGPDSELDDRDREQLIELLEEGAQTHGWETDLWTAPRVAALIEQEFGIDFTRRHCSRILRELGYRPVKPRETAAETDPEEKQRWLNEEAEQLKKADQWRDDPVYRRIAVSVRPSNDAEMGYGTSIRVGEIRP